MLAKRFSKRGFTLVELMIVVAIIGVLAALAIYGVRRYITSAKTAEARAAVGRMAKDASSAYARENMASTLLATKASTATINRLCATSTYVPAKADSIKGKKYQSSPSEWQAGDQVTGWRCLKFSIEDPQYFQYYYSAEGVSASGVDGEQFIATAHGDLNGDGTLSTFTLTGEIDADASGGLFVKLAPNMAEVNPDE